VACREDVAATLAVSLLVTARGAAEREELAAMLPVKRRVTGRGLEVTVEVAAIVAEGFHVKAGRVRTLVEPRRTTTPSPPEAAPVIFQATWKKRYSFVRVTVPPGVHVTVDTCVVVVVRLVMAVPETAPEVSSVAEEPSALTLFQMRTSTFPSAVPLPVPAPRAPTAKVQLELAKVPVRGTGVRKLSCVPGAAFGRAVAPKVPTACTLPAFMIE
jgi:hypothetical protein